MKNRKFSPGELSRGRTTYYIFALLNAFSFHLLGGNIITLYSIRLGASIFLIGLLASFIPLSQIMPLVGRRLVQRLGATRLMGTCWLFRYLSMAPILFAPIFIRGEDNALALALCIISVLFFHTAKGLGSTGYSAMVGRLTDNGNRGAFISNLTFIFHSASIIIGTAMALLLGNESPLLMYTFFMSAGILFGLAGTWQLFKLPELVAKGKEESDKIFHTLLHAQKRKDFRKFMTALLLLFFSISMITPFLILFLKQVYLQPDSSILFFLVIGSVGSIFVARASGFFLDRLGAKPLYFIFAFVILLVLVPMILSPSFSDPVLFWLYAGGILFFFNIGYIGQLTAGQIYFFSVILEKERLNLGIIYQALTGLVAALGSIAGGALLEAIQKIMGVPPVLAFRYYFCVMIVATFICLLFIIRLDKLGARSVGESLSVFFSPREIRTINLLNRLDKSSDLKQEQQVIKALSESHSSLSKEELISKLSSPRFVIRIEALTALAQLPLDREIEEALISEARSHSFTTAYRAAEIIGDRSIYSGVKVLRKSLTSEDFFLSGKAMVSLAKLNDRESIPQIEKLVERSSNPRIIIHGARALEIFGRASSLRLLISKLTERAFPFVRDEIILSIAGIIGIHDFFYPFYNSFLKKNFNGIFEMNDFIQEREKKKDPCLLNPAELLDLLNILNKPVFKRRALDFLDLLSINVNGKALGSILGDALQNASINKLERFRFLVAAVIIWYSFRPARTGIPG